jgi:hypothetical protein
MLFNIHFSGPFRPREAARPGDNPARGARGNTIKRRQKKGELREKSIDGWKKPPHNLILPALLKKAANSKF